MNISLELLARDLKKMSLMLEVTASTGSAASEMTLFGCTAFTKTVKLSKDTLVVIDHNDMILLTDDFLDNLKNSAVHVCYMGSEDKRITDNAIPHIRCAYDNNQEKGSNSNPEADIYDRIHGYINEIFLKYNRWQEELVNAMQECSCQRLMEAAVPIFNASCYLASADLKYIALSGPSLQYVENSIYVPVELVDFFKDDVRSIETTTYKTAFIYPSGILHADSLCCNIFVNNTFAARIIAIDEQENHQFSRCDLNLMDKLGAAVQNVLRQSYISRSFYQDNDIVSLVSKLLSGEIISQSGIDSVLLHNGWLISEPYFVGNLYMNLSDTLRDRNISFYCKYIAEHFSGVFPIPKSDNIVLFIRGSLYPNPDDFLKQFSPFVRDGNFRLGLSNPGYNVQQMMYLYRQADFALTCGMRENSSLWIHRFSDYALLYILREGTQNMPPEMLCAQEVRTLLAHDASNSTDYANTLKIYLDCRLNAVLTAKKLFIHHATMVYRLKRLQEITGVDFSDIEKLVHLFLSYKLLKT